jgi:hypothetical protein
MPSGPPSGTKVSTPIAPAAVISARRIRTASPPRGAVAVSDSAWVGAMRTARRPASRAATKVTSRPASAAQIRTGTLVRTANWAGTAPRVRKRAATTCATSRPSGMAGTAATAASTRLSRPRSRRSCPGVAPAVRSRASSRSRCRTPSATVPVSTKTAAKAVMPIVKPKMEIGPM